MRAESLEDPFSTRCSLAPQEGAYEADDAFVISDTSHSLLGAVGGTYGSQRPFVQQRGAFRSVSGCVEKAISPPIESVGIDADDDYKSDDDCGPCRGSKFPALRMESTETKRPASSKFEKDQVLPLTQWLLDHSSNPYPSMEDKAELANASGLSTQQVQNWFINMRKRHWTPMMNGKRKPRTFLDYVILSSKKSKKSVDDDCGLGPASTPVLSAARSKKMATSAAPKRKPMMRQAARKATNEISRLTGILQDEDAEEETSMQYDSEDDKGGMLLQYDGDFAL